MAANKSIHAWEAALIKKMIDSGGFTNDQILAYFSTPERPLSPFRLSEIKQAKLHGAVPPASNEQLTKFQQVFKDRSRARSSFFDTNPLHPASLDLLLPIENGTTDIVAVTETDRYEFKEGLNWLNKAQYGRTIAALANAKGGFLIFGVRNADRKVVGIAKGKVTKYDPAKLNQYLSAAFSPVPAWSMYEGTVAGLTVGIIAVERSTEKPIICVKNDGNELKEGAIFYRYPGETKLIKPGELAGLINERIRASETKWSRVFNSIAKSGVENAAVLDIASGLVSGPSGQFFIDETLLDKLKFVTEGTLSETEGAPTLRLIGDLQAAEAPVGAQPIEIPAPVNLSDDQIFEAFVARQQVVAAQVYVAHSALSAKKWLPIFYFIRLAQLSDEEAVALLEAQQGAKPKQVETMVERIGTKATPPGASQPHLSEPTRTQIIERALPTPTDLNGWKAFLKAVRTLAVGEVDPGFLLPMLQECWIDSANDGSLRLQCQYAVAHVDVIWHRQSLQ